MTSDIIQVIDQQKRKILGGRISNDQTASGTTSIPDFDRPTGFGTNPETGYAVGDYRLMCSFVGYKAILAQDTATYYGTAYVRYRSFNKYYY